VNLAVDRGDRTVDLDIGPSGSRTENLEGEPAGRRDLQRSPRSPEVASATLLVGFPGAKITASQHRRATPFHMATRIALATATCMLLRGDGDAAPNGSSPASDRVTGRSRLVL